MVQRIQIRRDTAALWTTNNPILLLGELGFERDTGKLKISTDGVSAWNALAYFAGGASDATAFIRTLLDDPDATTALATLGALPVAPGSVQTVNLADRAVSLPKLATLNTKTYLGRTAVGAPGDVEAITLATLQADLGISSPVGIAYTSVVPLDSVAGKRMASQQIVTNTTFTLGASPVTDGYCEMVLIGNGTNTMTFPAGWNRVQGSAPSNANGARSFLAFTYTYTGDVLYTVSVLSTVDTTAPTFGAATIADGLRSVINVAMSELIGATIPVAADITTGNAGGRTISSVTKSGVNLITTYSAPWDWQSTPTWAVTANKVSDAAVPTENLAIASGTLSVTNNAAMPVPGQPTALAAGTMTTTTAPLTWTAPAVNGTQGTIADYVIEYSLAGVNSWTVFADGTSTTPSTTVTGLATNTSYDFRVKASNINGYGAYSSTATASTTGSKITFTDNFTGTNGDAPNARWTQQTSGWTIQSNELAFAGASYGYIYATCTNGDNDLTITVGIAGWSTTNYANICIRYVDADNYVSLQKNGSNAEKLTLFGVVAGVVTTIDVEATASPTNVGDTLRIKNVGNTITAYRNGVQILTGTSASHSSATKIALGMNTSKATDRFEDAILA